jgi:DNA modification methylase
MARSSPLVDTRIIYCGDCLDQLAGLPNHCVDLIYIDPPFNSNRNYEVFWGETKEKRSFEDRHASTQAYKDAQGRRFRVSDMTANKPGGDTSYAWTGPDGREVKPYKAAIGHIPSRK